MQNIKSLKVKVKLRSQFHEVINERTDAVKYFTEMMAAASEIDPNVDEMLKSLFPDNTETMEMCTEGELYYGDGRIEVRYVEPEITEMGDSVTAVSFEEAEPGIIAVMRGGDVYTALILELGVRHGCVYNTELMPITIYTTAKQIKNTLSYTGGELSLVYTVEAQKGIVQFNRMVMTVTPLGNNSHN